MSYDVAVIGAGVIGVAVARAIVQDDPKLKVAVFEKEAACAWHTSGRNSGVVHAGFNLKPGSLKARFCVEGNRRLSEYCQANKIPYLATGTVVVALDAGQEKTLDELFERGTQNGVPGLRRVDAKTLKVLETNAQGVGALHAPSGAIVDTKAFVRSLAQEAREKNVHFYFVHEVDAIERRQGAWQVRIRHGGGATETFKSRLLVNCAGLYADKIAHMQGVGLGFSIFPFRGQYFYIRPEKSGIINSMVYPVPDLKYPFLGVHWTKKIDGRTAIGPNAMLALGRESYHPWDIHAMETLQMLLSRNFLALMGQPSFQRLALKQIELSLSRDAFARDAALLVRGAVVDDFSAGKAGNRAQLVGRDGKMVDDMLVITAEGAVHVLNAVSPGFTSSMPFAEHVAGLLKAQV